MDKNQKHQTASTEQSIRLNVGVVSNRSDGLGGSDTVHGVALAGLSGLSLQVEVDTLLASLELLLGVLLDTADEVLTGAGVLDVLEANVDALLDVAVVDNLVQEDTDGGLGHVVDDTGLTVEDLVGHTIDHLEFQRKGFLDTGISQIAVKGRDFTNPRCTAPLTWISTMSPTLEENYRQILAPSKTFRFFNQVSGFVSGSVPVGLQVGRGTNLTMFLEVTREGILLS